MIMFDDFLINYLQDKEVTLCFTNGESAKVYVEDFIFDKEVDKRGNDVVVLYGILAKLNGKYMTFKKEEIASFEVAESEI